MAVNLSKGQEVSLSHEHANLSKIIVGLGWDEVEQKKKIFFAPKPQPIDCDAFALLLSCGKLRQKEDVVYFGRLMHLSGAVEHMGDNLTGEGEGDDEQIMIDLNRVPVEYNRIVLAVNIYQAKQRKQHFGMIRNAFIRLVDSRNDNELCVYNLTENYANLTALHFGDLLHRDGEWKFNAIGQGTTDSSIGEFARRFQ